MIKVLVVDDSALVRKLFGRVLENASDFETRFARNGVEALQQLDEFRPDVITLDVHMPQMDGLECLDRIMVEHPCPVVMVSTLTAAGADATLEALRLGAVDFIPKPEGAVSLRIDEFAPTLVAKIRAAATARIKISSRLRERVLHRTRARAEPPIARPRRRAGRASGEGLVLVGTSTGGPTALEALLTPLPENFPWPILVAQHMPATFTGPLAKRLDQLCAVQVLEVLRPTVMRAGCVYIGRGDADLIVARRAAGLVALSAPVEPDYPWHPSTDRLVRSALTHLPARQLIGVLMTGMGDDGAAAMTALHAQGGRTIAESEDTAVVWGMPGELARAADLPDSVAGLNAALAHETTPRVREAIFTSLARIATPQSVEAVLGYLRSDDAHARTEACDALAAMKDAAWPQLEALLRDQDADVRVLACGLVRNMPSESAVPLFCELLESELAPNVCAAAIDALAEIGGAEALPVLERCHERFRATPFLAFAIKIAVDRIRAQSAPARV